MDHLLEQLQTITKQRYQLLLEQEKTKFNLEKFQAISEASNSETVNQLKDKLRELDKRLVLQNLLYEEICLEIEEASRKGVGTNRRHSTNQSTSSSTNTDRYQPSTSVKKMVADPLFYARSTFSCGGEGGRPSTASSSISLARLSQLRSPSPMDTSRLNRRLASTHLSSNLAGTSAEEGSFESINRRRISLPSSIHSHPLLSGSPILTDVSRFQDQRAPLLPSIDSRRTKQTLKFLPRPDSSSIEQDPDLIELFQVSTEQPNRKDVPAPRLITLERQLAHSALISWQPPASSRSNTTITSYHVYVDGQFRSSVLAAKEKTRALLENVDADKPHRISVRALSSRGQSKDAECTLVVGRGMTATPGRLKATQIASRSAKVSWMPGNSNYDHRVYLNRVELVTCPPGVYRLHLSDLQSDTLHHVCVEAIKPTDGSSLKPSQLSAPTWISDIRSGVSTQHLAAFIEFRTVPIGLPDSPTQVNVEPGPQDGMLLVTWQPVDFFSHQGGTTGSQTVSSSGTIDNTLPVHGYTVCLNGTLIAEVGTPSKDHCIIDLTVIKQYLLQSATTSSITGHSATALPSSSSSSKLPGINEMEDSDDSDDFQHPSSSPIPSSPHRQMSFTAPSSSTSLPLLITVHSTIDADKCSLSSLVDKNTRTSASNDDTVVLKGSKGPASRPVELTAELLLMSAGSHQGVVNLFGSSLTNNLGITQSLAETCCVPLSSKQSLQEGDKKVDRQPQSLGALVEQGTMSLSVATTQSIRKSSPTTDAIGSAEALLSQRHLESVKESINLSTTHSTTKQDRVKLPTPTTSSSSGETLPNSPLVHRITSSHRPRHQVGYCRQTRHKDKHNPPSSAYKLSHNILRWKSTRSASDDYELTRNQLLLHRGFDEVCPDCRNYYCTCSSCDECDYRLSSKSVASLYNPKEVERRHRHYRYNPDRTIGSRSIGDLRAMSHGKDERGRLISRHIVSPISVNRRGANINWLPQRPRSEMAIIASRAAASLSKPGPIRAAFSSSSTGDERTPRLGKHREGKWLPSSHHHRLTAPVACAVERHAATKLSSLPGWIARQRRRRSNHQPSEWLNKQGPDVGHHQRQRRGQDPDDGLDVKNRRPKSKKRHPSSLRLKSSLPGNQIEEEASQSDDNDYRYTPTQNRPPPPPPNRDNDLSTRDYRPTSRGTRGCPAPNKTSSSIDPRVDSRQKRLGRRTPTTMCTSQALTPPPQWSDRGPSLDSDSTQARIAVALYDYDPVTMSPNPNGRHEELPFNEGQLIKIFGECDLDGFYVGECNGLRGLVPSNMISEPEHDLGPTGRLVRPATSMSMRNRQDGRNIQQNVVKLTGSSANQCPQSVNQGHRLRQDLPPGQLMKQQQPMTSSTLRQQPEDQIGTRMRVISGKPNNYQMPTSNEIPWSDPNPPITSNRLPGGPRVWRRMQAIYDYDPNVLSPNQDAEVELTFRVGDSIDIIDEMDEDGFYVGQTRDGRQGLVPSNFLTPYSPGSQADNQSSIVRRPVEESNPTSRQLPGRMGPTRNDWNDDEYVGCHRH